MKRTAIKPGAKSLARGSSFKVPRAAMQRKPLKVQRRVQVAIDRHQREAWAQAARTKPCAICGSGLVVGHHVLYQQWLREVARTRGLDYERLRWDRRGLLSLCRRHHDAHHSANGPHVPLVVVRAHAPKVFQMARELGLESRLERTYPTEES